MKYTSGFRKENVAISVDLRIVSITRRGRSGFISTGEFRILALYKNSDGGKNIPQLMPARYMLHLEVFSLRFVIQKDNLQNTRDAHVCIH